LACLLLRVNQTVALRIRQRVISHGFGAVFNASIAIGVSG